VPPTPHLRYYYYPPLHRLAARLLGLDLGLVVGLLGSGNERRGTGTVRRDDGALEDVDVSFGVVVAKRIAAASPPATNARDFGSPSPILTSRPRAPSTSANAAILCTYAQNI
jgi:hypothetical protein